MSKKTTSLKKYTNWAKLSHVTQDLEFTSWPTSCGPRSYLVPLFTFEEPTASEKEKKSFDLFLRKLYSPSRAALAGLTLLSAEQCNTHWKIIVSVYEWIFSLYFIFFPPFYIKSKGKCKWHYMKKVWEWWVYIQQKKSIQFICYNRLPI